MVVRLADSAIVTTTILVTLYSLGHASNPGQPASACASTWSGAQGLIYAGDIFPAAPESGPEVIEGPVAAKARVVEAVCPEGHSNSGIGAVAAIDAVCEVKPRTKAVAEAMGEGRLGTCVSAISPCYAFFAIGAYRVTGGRWQRGGCPKE